MSFRETAPVANTSRSLPTTLAAEAHRAEGQCLLQGQAPNNENTLRLLGGTRRLTFTRIIIIIIIITIIITNNDSVALVRE
jgi:hypothetical protein